MLNLIFNIMYEVVTLPVTVLHVMNVEEDLDSKEDSDESLS